MASLKEGKITKIVREFVKAGDSYDITGIDLGLAKFFWRQSKELFADLATGDYRIDQSNGKQTLVILNSELLNRVEAFQVGYGLDFTASPYEVEWNVDINTLKEKYNTLVDNMGNLWEYVRKTGMIADDSTVNLILPQLDNDQFWIMQDGQYKAFDISDFRDLGERLLEAYVEYQKSLLELLFRNARENIITTKENSITEIQGLLDALNLNVDNFTGDKKLELQRIIDNFKAELSTIEVGNANALQGYQPMNFERVEPTIADLIASKKYNVGDVVEVLGYYEKGDGAGHQRQKKAVGYNEADAVIGTDGSIWGIVHSGEVNVSWFGAKSDNITNNTQFIQNAINLKNTNVIVIDNDYYISETIIFSCSKTLEFKGKLIIDNEFSATNDCVIFSSMWGQDAKLGAPHFIRPHIETKRYSTFNTSTEVATYKDFVDCCGIILHATAMASIHQPTILGLKKDGIIIAGGYGARLDNSLIRTIPATLDILGDINFTNIGDIGGEYFQNKRYPAGISVYGTDCFIDNCQTVNYPVGIYTKNANEFVNCHPWAIPQTTKTKMLYGFVVTGTGNRLMGCYADTVSNINNLYEGLNGGVGFYETKNTDHTIKEVISDRNIFINSKILGTNFSSEGTFSFSLGDSASNSAGLGDCLVATIGVNVRPEHVKLYNTKIQNILSYNSLGEFDNVFRYLTVNTLNFSNEDNIRISGTGYLKLKSKNLQINDQSVTREVSIDGVNKYPVFLPTTTISKLSDITSLGRYGTLSFLYTGQEIEAGSCGLKFEGTKNQSLVNTPSGKLLFINGNQISTIQTSANFQSLDTPFHASNMSRLGILDKYHNYLAELHEYENSQNVPEGVMNLNVLQPPVIPTEVEEYAKEYNLI